MSCSNDYTTTTNVGYMILGTATTTSTVPTTDEACSAIKLAEVFINGHLHMSTSYTTIPAAITGIATRIAVKIIQVQKWWAVTEGATSDSDYQGSANYDGDLLAAVMSQDIKDDLDVWKQNEDYILSGSPGLVIRTPQQSDLDMSRDEYV